MVNRRRLLELVKSLLILLLTLSALYLAGRAFWNTGAGVPGFFGGLLPSAQTPAADRTLTGAAVLAPVRMAVVNPTGRYGAQYNDAAVDQLFDDLGGLLGEALGSAQPPQLSTRLAWEQALERVGVYYGLNSAVPLSLAASWLGEPGSPAAQLDALSDQLLLAKDRQGERVVLYYVDARDGSYYSCDTAVSFQTRLDDYAPNGAFFAFQEAGRYDALHPDTLILPQVPTPPVCQASVGLDLSGESTYLALIETLRFSPQPSAVYPSADGWSIRDGGDILRLSRTGAVTYSAGEQSTRYPVLADPTAHQVVELTGELAWQALSPTCGAAKLCLSSLEQSGNTWTVTYSYVLSGAQVHLGQQGWCAQFILRDGSLTEYTLWARRYDPTEETAVLLPEYRAMAAMDSMGAGGRRLLLRYYDAGGDAAVTPVWIAR